MISSKNEEKIRKKPTLVQIPIGFQFCSLKTIGKMTILSRMMTSHQIGAS